MHGKFYIKQTQYGFSIISMNDVAETEEFAAFEDGHVLKLGSEPFDVSLVDYDDPIKAVDAIARVMGYEEATSSADFEFCTQVIMASRLDRSLDEYVFGAPQAEEKLADGFEISLTEAGKAVQSVL